MKSFICYFLGILLLPSLHAQFPDEVFHGGKVFTSNDSQPFAEGFATKNGIFFFVGSNQDVMNLVGPSTKVVDLKGRLILPGIHDVHMHPLEAGSPIGGGCILDNEEPDPEELGTALHSCNLQTNTNGWRMAFGHSIFTLYDATRNPYEILDDYYPGSPMVVMEETSHSVWVNSMALQMMGITSSSQDPTGGHIFKDPFGDPDGILMDNAGDAALSLALAPNSTIDSMNYKGLVDFSLPLLAENGITSICEGRTYWKRNYIPIWQKIKNDGLLTVRVNLAPWVYPSDNDATQIPMLQSLYDAGDDMLRVSQIKVYADGILINATAALHDPYVDNLGLPFNKGLNYIDSTRMAALITTLEKTGFDFHIHAIGDRGITEALGAIEKARNTNGNIGARHRITHLEIVDPLDYNRFAQLNVTADMQVAGEFTNPANWGENDFLVGSNRTQNFVPLKSIFNSGARVTLSSDWDVSSASPFVGIQHAVTRFPQELPSVEEAVKAYTIHGAYVMRQETKTGSIEIGKFADFICVDKDIFTIPSNTIGQTKVLNTFLNGVEIYRNPILNSIDSENIIEKISIFLNPSDSNLKIKFEDLLVSSLSLFDTQGKQLDSIVVRNQKKVEINISVYAPGIYLIKFELQNGQTVSKKFIKH